MPPFSKLSPLTLIVPVPETLPLVSLRNAAAGEADVRVVEFEQATVRHRARAADDGLAEAAETGAEGSVAVVEERGAGGDGQRVLVAAAGGTLETDDSPVEGGVGDVELGGADGVVPVDPERDDGRGVAGENPGRADDSKGRSFRHGAGHADETAGGPNQSFQTAAPEIEGVRLQPHFAVAANDTGGLP